MRTPVLQATLATDGLIGTAAGPRDPGTAYVLAHHYAGRALGVQGAWGFVRGGMGAVSHGRRRGGARGRRRAAHRQRGRTHRAARRPRRAARAARRHRDRCRQRSSSTPTRKTLFLRLLEPGDVPPALHARARAWRTNGVSLKINLALGELPDFTRAARHARSSRTIARRSTSRRRSTFCSRPTTTRAVRHVRASRCSSASCKRPTDPSLAPPGKHILSIFAQYFPYDRTTGRGRPRDRDAIADRIVAQLAAYAPNMPNAIEHRQILAPPDLEALLGLAGGHIFHGELLPGQIYERRFGVRTGIDGSTCAVRARIRAAASAASPAAARPRR